MTIYAEYVPIRAGEVTAAQVRTCSWAVCGTASGRLTRVDDKLGQSAHKRMGPPPLSNPPTPSARSCPVVSGWSHDDACTSDGLECLTIRRQTDEMWPTRCLDFQHERG